MQVVDGRVATCARSPVGCDMRSPASRVPFIISFPEVISQTRPPRYSELLPAESSPLAESVCAASWRYAVCILLEAISSAHGSGIA